MGSEIEFGIQCDSQYCWVPIEGKDGIVEGNLGVGVSLVGIGGKESHTGFREGNREPPLACPLRHLGRVS